ncbi:MAG: FAD-binding protein [Rhodospirillaceae bacterium]|nr:FAD-binding protein [Rhodospirillaceae bacterium]MBT6428155.1 FAD-binding protein [Rhodospirillaceae bacterium]MBT7758208.1 FAD-binding protein [Rhodospirillaceae bacterium]
MSLAVDNNGAQPLPESLIATLTELLGERFTMSNSVREHHGKGEAYHTAALPDGVAYGNSTDEVSAIVKACAAHGTPVIPYGTGTALEGHTLALRGGISLDVSGMDQVIRVSPEDMDCTVQAGVTRNQLNEYLRDTGLFFPVDPGADASLGGMSATRASGTTTVRYGAMRENVLALTVVLADGRVIQTARRARKSSAGYDLTRLFVGSEGTLGVITEVTLRLFGIPEATQAAVCSFPDLESAVNTVITVVQCGIPIARCELLDKTGMKMICDYGKLDDYTIGDTLFMEFHGSEAGVTEQAAQVQAIAADYGAGDFKWASKPEDRTKLWEARHNGHYAILATAKPGQNVMATDVCVPVSRLAECILATKEDLEQSGLVSPFVGHAGDGNFHMSIIANYDDEAENKLAHDIHDRLVHRAQDMEGTCTGEHGIGSGKIDYLEEELGGAVDVMRAVKRALDPDNIMNPGKILRL